MKFLITGFEPFYTNETNPSSEILKYLSTKDIKTLVLPVTYFGIKEKIEASIQEFKPDFVIALGLAQMRPNITLEQVAINYMYATIPDNAGKLELGSLIDPKGDKAYFTPLLLPALVNELKEVGFDVSLSTSAGSYVCNSTYYQILKMAKTYNYQGLFIHLPSEKTLPLEEMIKAIKTLIKIIEGGNYGTKKVCLS